MIGNSYIHCTCAGLYNFGQEILDHGYSREVEECRRSEWFCCMEVSECPLRDKTDCPLSLCVCCSCSRLCMGVGVPLPSGGTSEACEV